MAFKQRHHCEIAGDDALYMIQQAKQDPRVKGIVLKTADLENYQHW